MPKTQFWPMLALSIFCPAATVAAQDWTQKLPEGAGKAAAYDTCVGRHEFFGRIGKGYTPEGWKTVIRMMFNQGASMPEDYLAKNYPEQGKPAGVMIPGPVKVSFQQRQVPTPGSRPHDPLAAHDGSFWNTAELANHLGRIDPKTGGIKEFPLRSPHGGPQGLIDDSDGNIWYMANTGALIGKLNPKMGEVTEYPPIRIPLSSTRPRA
jgi:virginiamycin B lyase